MEISSVTRMNLSRLPILLFLAISSAGVTAQVGGPPTQRADERDMKLPSGKSQKDEILKADHTKNIEDAQRIAELGEELKKVFEKTSHFVLSVSDLKRLDEIEKMTKRIRGRLKRY